MATKSKSAKKKKAPARKKAAAKPASRKVKVLNRIRSLKDAVQDAIDNGATNAHEVYQRIAAMPFDQLARIAVLEGLVEKARGVHDHSVGAVYDLIRTVNQRVGELADAALNRIDNASGMP